jgi:putative hemolysin
VPLTLLATLPTSAALPDPRSIPPGSVTAVDYALRFATSERDVDAAQRLRHRVFTEELGEGLPGAEHTGRDIDPLDEQMHHLLIEDQRTRSVVGTYRLQTASMAAASPHGWYASSLFDLSTLPVEVRRDGVEIGRACVDRTHRNGRVLRLLWRGLARYLQWNERRYLFGCCSIPSRDSRDATAVRALLCGAGAVDPTLSVAPLVETRCRPDDRPIEEQPALRVPPLMQGYLSLGARVISEPAFDAAFGSIDCLVLLDIEAMSPRTFRTWFGATT